jgi:hypothetical protein
MLGVHFPWGISVDTATVEEHFTPLVRPVVVGENVEPLELRTVTT